MCHDSLDAQGGCDVCEMALRSGRLIEEVRLEVEEAARWGCHHFGQAEGLRCDCGAGSGAVHVQGPVPRGRPPKSGPKRRLEGMIHFEVTHAPGCPLAPPAFEWPAVDEAERRRVFGYDARTVLAARLVRALAHERHWREVMED